MKNAMRTRRIQHSQNVLYHTEFELGWVVGFERATKRNCKELQRLWSIESKEIERQGTVIVPLMFPHFSLIGYRPIHACGADGEPMISVSSVLSGLIGVFYFRASTTISLKETARSSKHE